MQKVQKWQKDTSRNNTAVNKLMHITLLPAGSPDLHILHISHKTVDKSQPGINLRTVINLNRDEVLSLFTAAQRRDVVSSPRYVLRGGMWCHRLVVSSSLNLGVIPLPGVPLGVIPPASGVMRHPSCWRCYEASLRGAKTSLFPGPERCYIPLRVPCRHAQ